MWRCLWIVAILFVPGGKRGGAREKEGEEEEEREEDLFVFNDVGGGMGWVCGVFVRSVWCVGRVSLFPPRMRSAGNSWVSLTRVGLF